MEKVGRGKNGKRREERAKQLNRFLTKLPYINIKAITDREYIIKGPKGANTLNEERSFAPGKKYN